MRGDGHLPQRLYERLASEVAGQISSHVLRPGDRLPSVRVVSRQKMLSATTVRQAYQALEDRGLIDARPQSGYYVRRRPTVGQVALDMQPDVDTVDPQRVQLQDLSRRVRDDASSSKLVQFGAAVPSPDLLPGAQLNNTLARIVRSGRVPPHLLGTAQGSRELRLQVARRAFLSGCQLTAEDVYITNGCTEALYLALRAVCQPGDLVAIESPTYFGILQVIEALDLRVLEIPCEPTCGLPPGLTPADVSHSLAAFCRTNAVANVPADILQGRREPGRRALLPIMVVWLRTKKKSVWGTFPSGACAAACACSTNHRYSRPAWPRKFSPAC